MKRAGFVIIVLLCLFVCFKCETANAISFDHTARLENRYSSKLIHESNAEHHSSFTLPSGLTVIGDSAFEGTAITSVEVPENVLFISEYAFANIETLRIIKLPNNIEYISESAFVGSNKATIIGSPEGYVCAYAQKNRIPFNPIDSLYALNIPTRQNELVKVEQNKRKFFLDNKKSDHDEHRWHADREKTIESNTDRYANISVYHIQGRSPPI